MYLIYSRTGFLSKIGAIDFAGGLVVHVNSGVSALVASWMLADQKRGGFPARSHNLPLTFVGFILLWFGWMAFNGGSALSANSVAAYAIANTNIAAAAGKKTYWRL